jgi:hypothetical protein
MPAAMNDSAIRLLALGTVRALRANDIPPTIGIAITEKAAACARSSRGENVNIGQLMPHPSATAHNSKTCQRVRFIA